jgi:hypothetical protein
MYYCTYGKYKRVLLKKGTIFTFEQARYCQNFTYILKMVYTGCHVAPGMIPGTFATGTFATVLDGRHVTVSGLREKGPLLLY